MKAIICYLFPTVCLLVGTAIVVFGLITHRPWQTVSGVSFFGAGVVMFIPLIANRLKEHSGRADR